MKRLPKTKHYSMTGTQLSVLIEKAIDLGKLHGRGAVDRAAHQVFLEQIHERAAKYKTTHFNLSTPAGRKKAQQHFATHQPR